MARPGSVFAGSAAFTGEVNAQLEKKSSAAVAVSLECESFMRILVWVENEDCDAAVATTVCKR